jgi:hypothetical protein
LRNNERQRHLVNDGLQTVADQFGRDRIRLVHNPALTVMSRLLRASRRMLEPGGTTLVAS